MSDQPDPTRAARTGNRRAVITFTCVVAVIAAGVVLLSSRPDSRPEDTPRYEYQNTRRLVRFVEKAAERVEAIGEAAFVEFGDPSGPWFDVPAGLYAFVYDAGGICHFHPTEPELRGKNLLDLTDIDGKHMIRAITAIGTSGWTHYRWVPPGAIFPLWKSSYIVRTRAPGGRVYFVGAGLYNMRVEKQFVRDAVDRAAALIEEKGDAAFATVRDPASDFVFLGTYIFVIGMDGTALLDPSFPSERFRNLMNMKDMDGRPVVREMLERVKNRDSAWVMFMWPRPGDSRPSRKLAYVRKVRCGDRFVIVGSDYFQPTPIWMRM